MTTTVPKWFPPATESLEDIEARETKKLKVIASNIYGRIDYVTTTLVPMDSFPITFDSDIRKATIVPFLKEVISYYNCSEVSNHYCINIYLCDYPGGSASLLTPGILDHHISNGHVGYKYSIEVLMRRDPQRDLFPKTQ